MTFQKILMSAAAATVVAEPVAEQAAPVERSSQSVSEGSELRSGDPLRALIIVLIGAIGMGVLLLTDDDNAPVSP